ncbi:hypothetical protein Pst134EB_030061 [Puccinia striiformis f. sp. tritici]|nr:hypothetical protein Pst134EB_030061 [Puccinia striiformis f. sp. tritici]
MASTPPNPPQAGIIVPPEVWAQMQQFMAALGPPGPIVIPPAPAPIVTPLAQSCAIMIDEGSLIMDIDYEEHLSDPPPKILVLTNSWKKTTGKKKKTPCEMTSQSNPLEILSFVQHRNRGRSIFATPLDPPPIDHFLSMADLLAFCQEWAKHHGYAVSKAQSNANKNVYIRCDCLGEFRGQRLNPSGRQTATKKIGCPFEVKGSIPTSQKIMNKTWTLEIRVPEHNHEPSDSPLAHAAHK